MNLNFTCAYQVDLQIGIVNSTGLRGATAARNMKKDQIAVHLPSQLTISLGPDGALPEVSAGTAKYGVAPLGAVRALGHLRGAIRINFTTCQPWFSDCEHDCSNTHISQLKASLLRNVCRNPR